MANPKIEDGYTKIANELLEAIIKTRMSDYEHRVFWLIVRKTYGFNKKSDWIAQKQIVLATGILKQNVSRIIKNLLERNMITKVGKILSIQKDYDRWKLSKEIMKVISTDYKSNLNRGTQNNKKIQKKVYTDRYITLDKEVNKIFKNMEA